ncbi:hypothetical protein QBC42DRAFT_227576 [Cladorrhinum samala]|uniref:NWD NACHT-NTPase N-terminal domain-containing protein n=1 Tax=Cladorrhinum samala TaxID=585594 RepID=A0AAV9HKE7_9PEZI|nr:hypothetical protein QBC42DRAFT_227576 [Cladorrhinum samala]
MGLHRSRSSRSHGIAQGILSVHHRLVNTISIDNVAECLWNQAYDEISQGNPRLVTGYETILVDNLIKSTDKGSTEKSAASAARVTISRERDARRNQMRQLVQHGLRKAQNAGAVSGGLNNVAGVAQAVKGVVDSAVQASPQAALAWAGISVMLEVFQNPWREMESNREGILYIARKMEWYWDLANLILPQEEDKETGSAKSLRRQLEREITDLYAAILSYQMMSVCYYDRSRRSAFFRGLFRLDDWEGTLNRIKAMEEAFRKDCHEFNSHRHLYNFEKAAERAAEKLAEKMHMLGHGSCGKEPSSVTVNVAMIEKI